MRVRISLPSAAADAAASVSPEQRILARLLTASPQKRDRWVASTDASVIAAVLGQINSPELAWGTVDLGPLWLDLTTRIRTRPDADKILIWADADAEPPDFVWKDGGGDAPPPCARTRSHRVAGRKTHPVRSRRGEATNLAPRGKLTALFQKEQRLRSRDSEFPARTERKRDAPPLFYESVGDKALFSPLQAEFLYHNAELQLGRDSVSYVRSVITEAMKLGSRRAMAKAPAIEDLLVLRERFPNATEVIDYFIRAAALAHLSPSKWMQASPLLVAGEPGIGKTAVLQAIARVLKAPFTRIDIGAISTGTELFGTSLSWSTGRVGQIFRLLTQFQIMNPVLMLDEIDKALGNAHSPVVPPLLTLLEPETARRFNDEAVPLTLDASQIIWVAAANDLTEMSAPLRSRFTVVEMHRPTGESAIAVARSIYNAILDRMPWGRAFPRELDGAIAVQLANYVPRAMSAMLLEACGRAACAGRNYLIDSDIVIAKDVVRRRAGFM